MSYITYMTAVMLAYLNGAKIEMRPKHNPKSYWYSADWSPRDVDLIAYKVTHWCPVDNPLWAWDRVEYRVAQENSDER